MADERRFITVEEAISLLPEKEEIHTFKNPNETFLIGCDYSREEIIKKLKDNPETIEIGGDFCRAMRHGLVLNDNTPLFIETDPEKLNAFDPIY